MVYLLLFYGDIVVKCFSVCIPNTLLTLYLTRKLKH